MITKEDLISKGLELIPISDLVIKKDDTITTGYDLTVDDYYTFATADGVFVQDCMAIYVSVTDKSYQDIKNKIMISKNIINPANGDISTEPNQDIVLGIYTLTESSDKEVLCKGIMMSKGRSIFNECLPKTYPPINRLVTKKVLKIILNRISKLYSSDELMCTLDNIKKAGFKKSTSMGFTLSINDLYNSRLREISEEFENNYEKDMNRMKTDKELDSILKNMSFSKYIESGARGSWDQARQLVLTRGYVADSNNNIRQNMIRSSLITGMNPEEYFRSCYGCRKGLLDTALSTSDTGYITRQLIYAIHFVEMVNEEDITSGKYKSDCGTEEYLPINLFVLNDKKDPTSINKDKSLDIIKSLIGRYYKLNKSDTKLSVIKLDEDFMNNLIGKTIFLRSPIYCKSEKICRTCYGLSYKYVNSDQIGMVAVQSLGERMTQLVLRTFHTSGVVQKSTKDSLDKNDDIINGMMLVKTLLHRPATICTPEEPEKLVTNLYKLFIQYGKINMVHFETIVSAMLWNKEDLWRTMKDRDSNTRKWESILRIPALYSWLIGLAFSNLKSELLRGLISEKSNKESSLTSLFKL